MSELNFHALAEIFPLLEGSDFNALITDIAAHGLHEPIVIYENKILDGRNRYRACIAAGVEPKFTAYKGSDPVAFVVSLNLKRRHLNESQRALVAARLAMLGHGANQGPSGKFAARSDIPTQATAAEMLNVSERTVRSARVVVEHGGRELQQAVERGKVKVSVAADVATAPFDEQRAIVTLSDREILERATAIRGRKAEKLRAERIERINETSNNNAPLPQGRRFPIIYADPPWQHTLYSEESGNDRVASRHYPLMDLQQICALPVGDLATPVAGLFLWTTAPHLQESFAVIERWGFQYVTGLVWVKDRIGLGHWVRGQHEHLLIARRGDFPTPTTANRPSSVIQAPIREHSRKPDKIYGLIESMYPELAKIELFARAARKGWEAWGNQLSKTETAA